MKKKDKALIFNIVIFILELIGFIMTIVNDKKFAIEFYTNESNILMLIGSGLYILYALRKKDIPKWLQTFKYICASALALTFMVVILVLAPMYNFNYGWMLFYRQLSIYHTLGPILSIISFILYEEYHSNKVLPAISYTLLYALVMITLNICNVVDGPYPFLRVMHQPVWASILWCSVILLINYGLSFLLLKFNKKKNVV